MNSRIKLVLAIVVGLVVGGIVNYGMVILGPSVIDYPEGMDISDEVSFKAHAHLLTSKHFMWAFLAHALGALTGAFSTAKLAAVSKMKYALFIGVFFLVGGIAMVQMIPAPGWFVALDLIAAYIPMAWIGGKLAGAK